MMERPASIYPANLTDLLSVSYQDNGFDRSSSPVSTEEDSQSAFGVDLTGKTSLQGKSFTIAAILGLSGAEEDAMNLSVERLRSPRELGYWAGQEIQRINEGWRMAPPGLRQGSGMSVPYWDFLGSTIVTTNYVRLTPDLQSKSGALWNTQPCYTRNWELQVQFKVHGRGKDLFGDGLALWYVKDRMTYGPVFGSKDYYQGLAIILDTYSNHNGAHNHQHPYISATINNGTLHYDHDRDGTHTQLAGCEAKFRNYQHDTHISIVYKDDTLVVSTDLEGKNAWKECLRVEKVLLPTGYYFGASATTGDLSDNHDIIAVKMYELDLLDSQNKDEDRSHIIPSAQSFEAPREHVDDPKPAMSGVKTFLYMMCIAIVVIVCVVLGIMWYQKRQEHSRKRLY